MNESVWFWIMCGGVGVLLVFLAWYGGRRRRLRPVEVDTATEAVCANCGYDVRGLPGHTCPECGSDLNEVGRLTPRFRKWQKAPPIARALIWTVAVLVIGAILAITALSSHLPMHLTMRSERIIGLPPILSIEERVESSDHGWGLIDAIGDARSNYVPSAQRLVAEPALRNGPDDLELSWNVLDHTWRLKGSGTSDASGEGPPPLDAIDAFVTALFGRPATRPASRPADWTYAEPLNTIAEGAALPVTPERARLLLYLKFHRFQSGIIELRETRNRWQMIQGMTDDEREAYQRAQIASLPDGLFEGDTNDYFVMMFAPRPNAGGLGRDIRPDYGPLALAIGYWLLVWITGGVFVVRRRAVREVSRESDPTASR